MNTALRPGGKLILSDDHPVRGCLHVTDGQIEIDRDYFSRERPYREDGWLGALARGAPSHETHYEFNWPLGDIVTSLARAGMRIDYLEEFSGPPAYYQVEPGDGRVPPLMDRLPKSYQLTATREGRR